jgi:AraC-like DNA-binding protein
MEKTLKIKGMVCRRCIEIVKSNFQSLGLVVYKIQLGEVSYEEKEASSLKKINELLQGEGFEILTDKQSSIINKVKELIDNELMRSEGHSKKFATIVSETLNMEYDTVSTLFSFTEGIKLEQYVIGKRVEKVQELLKHTHLSLTDIAFMLGYSSVHHLSNQFKKITGMSPSQYRELQSGLEQITK